MTALQTFLQTTVVRTASFFLFAFFDFKQLLKMGHSRPLFSLFSSFQYSWQETNVQYKFCRWLDSNREPPVLQATALPAGPQPLTPTRTVHLQSFLKCDNAGLFFFHFRSFHNPITILALISTIQTENVVAVVLGIGTRGCKMVGADVSTVLWRLPHVSSHS